MLIGENFIIVIRIGSLGWNPVLVPLQLQTSYNSTDWAVSQNFSRQVVSVPCKGNTSSPLECQYSDNPGDLSISRVEFISGSLFKY